MLTAAALEPAEGIKYLTIKDINTLVEMNAKYTQKMENNTMTMWQMKLMSPHMAITFDLGQWSTGNSTTCCK